MSLIPEKLCLVKVFTSREYQRLNPDTWRTERVEEYSDPLVDQLINRWINETRADVQQISAPQVNVYGEKGKSQVHLVYTSVSLLYFSAIEGVKDEDAKPARSDSMGAIPGQVESGDSGKNAVCKPAGPQSRPA